MTSAYDEAQVKAFLADCAALYKLAGRTPDQDALVWPMRMEHDAAVDADFGYAQSRPKHLEELRVALGLAPAAPTPASPQTVTCARDIVRQTTNDHLNLLLGPFMSDDEGSEACGHLVELCLTQLEGVGIRAARQRNPSGVISNDKLCVYVTNGDDTLAWHAFDIASIGGQSHPGTPGWLEVVPPNPVL